MLSHKSLTNMLNCLTPYIKIIRHCNNLLNGIITKFTSYYIQITLLPKVIGKLALSEYVV